MKTDTMIHSIKKTFCFLPKICQDTNKPIWFKYGYYYDTEEVMTETIPASSNEYCTIIYSASNVFWISEPAHTIRLLKR